MGFNQAGFGRYDHSANRAGAVESRCFFSLFFFFPFQNGLQGIGLFSPVCRADGCPKSNPPFYFSPTRLGGVLQPLLPQL